MCAHVHTFVCVHTCNIHMFTRMCVHVCARTYICVCVHACMYSTYMHERMCTHMCVRTCAYVHTHVHARTHVHTYMCVRTQIRDRHRLFLFAVVFASLHTKQIRDRLRPLLGFCKTDPNLVWAPPMFCNPDVSVIALVFAPA